MANPHEGGPELVTFPPNCELVLDLIDQVAGISEDDVQKIIEDLQVSVDDDTTVLKPLVDRVGLDSLGLVRSVEAGDADCETCGGCANPARETICSLGSLISRLVG